ncbi:MAG: SIKE family protein [Acidobacteriia bacterium]|nr:SIKE family protein [Terriglobia bacterium]
MGVLDALKDAGQLAKGLASIEDKQKLLDLQVAALEIAQRNAQLEQENRELREKLRIRDELTFRENVYWRDGQADKGPFCPPCWDSRGLLVHLTETTPNVQYDCRSCGKYFTLRPAPPVIPRRGVKEDPDPFRRF